MSRRKAYGPPRPCPVVIECETPRGWRWFRNHASEQGWTRTGPDGQYQLTDRLDRMPIGFWQALDAAGGKIVPECDCIDCSIAGEATH